MSTTQTHDIEDGRQYECCHCFQVLTSPLAVVFHVCPCFESQGTRRKYQDTFLQLSEVTLN